MEEGQVINLIQQYLHEKGYKDTLQSLEKESGRLYNTKSSSMSIKSGQLQEILDDYSQFKKAESEAAVSVHHLFKPGDGSHANELWTSLDYLTEGYNVLVVRLTETGALALGGSKAMLVTTDIPVPLVIDSPPHSVISNTHKLCNGAILSLDFHPIQRNLLLCGSMDQSSFVINIELPDNPLIQKFNDHTKYVVRTLWSRNGDYFVTGSYDRTVCIYRVMVDSTLYELIGRLQYKGTIESLAMSKTKDTFIVGVRNDNTLHVVDFSSGEPSETRQINMNAIGDDHVSFNPMHISLSPDEKFVLVSTDQDRLILYTAETGKMVTNFYGATNDEYSQPRHCWDPSGRYIYSTSQDKSICVWEILTQNVVARLTGHGGMVRDLYYCDELKLLVSCGFDGAVKLWINNNVK